jgi:DNA-binding XRE family transcriptional regulator
MYTPHVHASIAFFMDIRSRGVYVSLAFMEDHDFSGSSIPDIARRLIATRQALGMNQRAFAAYCGITPQTLNNYERKRQRPSLDYASKLAACTGTSIDWIYHGTRAHLPHDLAVKIFSRTPGKNSGKRA